jgi:Transcriptional regulator, effector-binding domain/component
MTFPASYQVRAVSVSPRLVAGVHAEVQSGRVGQEFARYLDQVYAAGRAGVVALDGQNVFIYRALDGNVLSVDFCVGAKAPFTAAGPVLPLETPGGVAAMTTHHGDYGKIGDANAAIMEWCRTNNRRRAGPSWEVYGHWDPDVSKLRTDIYYLLRPHE